ncbi:MAG: hypothetical protein GY715_14985 [Planctomycetes bacterium]|nr:hypothetical protein [Planctomycetota bacterium]
MMIRALVVTAVALAPAVAAGAAWPDDPFANLPIGDTSGQQNQAKVRATPDGGAYVSWFDNNAGGWDVRLQRLDAQGNELWAHNGVLVADRGFSSTQDYGLAVDTGGNALLTFRDDRFTGVQITATKVAPDGSMPWGATGVQLTNTTDFVAAPDIAGTTDGNVVVAWRQGDDVRLRKLASAGFPFWITDTTLTDPGESLSVSELCASDAGSVIVGLVRGFFGAQLHAQKISSVGATMWGASPVVVFDGSLQNGNFPGFVTDGSGGAVFGWYGTGPLQCYVQRIAADGSEVFPHNGVEASTNASRLRVAPTVSYRPATSEVFLFWTELNSVQSQWGLYGQKFDAAGARQWGTEGAVLVPVGGAEITMATSLAFGDGALVFHADTPNTFGDKRIRATRVDTNGAFVWSPSFTEACALEDGKMRLDADLTVNGVAVLAWSDERNDSGDIYAQNVNRDGTLGRRNADVNGDGTVSFADILAIIGAWGPCPPGDCPADVTGDMTVGFADILGVIGAWDGP